jgi:3-oxoacyl-[acyl-carrier-protein] synthase-3
VVPPRILSNDELAAQFEGWTAEKILKKTGIRNRRVVEADQCSSDLAVAAGNKLLESGVIAREEVDFLLLCTQSPDYFLPTTACLVQERLCLPRTCGALDFNLGCSGFVYGLSLAKGLVETGSARTVLLITAETYSKFIHPADKSVRTIFGDGAAATLVQSSGDKRSRIGPFLFGTDGRGAKNLIVPRGGMRCALDPHPRLAVDESGNARTENNIFMNGPELFAFTLREVPRCVAGVLEKSNMTKDNVDFFVFHQANAYMLEQLRKKISIPPERFVVSFSEWGNTVSSTIPIAIKSLADERRLFPGAKLLLVGFGVGYSWGACMLEWK